MYIFLAIIPALVLLIWLYHRDVLHPEPKRKVYRMFLLGASVVFPAGLLERALLDTSVHAEGLTSLLVTAFFVAGMVEEFLKSAIVDRAAYARGYLQQPIDCLVYAGAVALGFATVENVMYVTSSGFTTAVLRSVTAVPAHLMFGIIMGSGYVRHIWFKRSIAWAYILPALAHGLYDSFALSNTMVGDIALVLYLLILLEVCLRRIDWAGKLSVRLNDIERGLSQIIP
ncbi:MAG: PrsW family intramembrane metalloprotease [Alicyclobacillus sp.]|nr:PrsW family intramembrane metalloprotease [Alicyclobacillus sp.]